MKAEKLIITLCAVAWLLGANAQDAMHYELSFEPENHIIDVKLNLKGVTTPDLLLKMPVWAPGYYIILDSPKHLHGFKAQDGAGNPLQWAKEQKTGWHINTKNADEVVVNYRIFANQQSVGEAMVDSLHAYLPGNEVYMYVDGRKDLPATVSVTLPDGWSSACTGLKANTATEFYASDYDRLVDSPIYAGSPSVHQFSIDGRDYAICVADKKNLDLDKYEAELTKMVNAATELMGHVPYDNYCFLWMEPGRGGLEHINSQACFVDDGLYAEDKDGHRGWMNFVTHEYFHLYNVKCIRPIELGPFDYDRENYTDQLWVSEGLTCYYEYALMRRAGLSDGDEMKADLMEMIRDTETTPGRNMMPLSQSSYDIWLNFFNKDANSSDVRISYYVKGPVVGLMLDLAIRQATENRRSLDDLMRLLYNRYYREQERGFTTDEFWASATEVAEGNPLDDIRSYVFTTEPIDYDKYLGYAGLSLDRNSWTFHPLATTTSLQQSIHASIFGE